MGRNYLGLNAHLGLDPGPQGGFECDEGDENYQGPPITKKCDRCGATDLEWVDVGGGRWRLYEGLKLHKCKRPSIAEAFKDVKL